MVTATLLEFLKLPQDCHIWEPACGQGHMVNVMRRYGYQVTGTDIISGTDYLRKQKMPDDTGAIITNPPFNLSEKFIRKSMAFGVPVVAMLLKAQYWHAQARYRTFCKFPPAWVLPLTWRPDFLLKNGNPTMDVIWTVWLQGDTTTKYQPLLKPKLLYAHQLIFE
jgi:hypothetical protein